MAHSRELARRSPDPRTELVVVPGGHHRSVQHDAELQGHSLRWLRRVITAPAARRVERVDRVAERVARVLDDLTDGRRDAADLRPDRADDLAGRVPERRRRLRAAGPGRRAGGGRRRGRGDRWRALGGRRQRRRHGGRRGRRSARRRRAAASSAAARGRVGRRLRRRRSPSPAIRAGGRPSGTRGTSASGTDGRRMISSLRGFDPGAVVVEREVGGEEDQDAQSQAAEGAGPAEPSQERASVTHLERRNVRLAGKLAATAR